MAIDGGIPWFLGTYISRIGCEMASSLESNLATVRMSLNVSTLLYKTGIPSEYIRCDRIPCFLLQIEMFFREGPQAIPTILTKKDGFRISALFTADFAARSTILSSKWQVELLRGPMTVIKR